MVLNSASLPPVVKMASSMRVVGAEVAGVALDDGLAHVGNAGHDGVAGEVGVDGGDGRVLDVARGGEVRLAGAEIHQVGALRAQLGGLGGHGHGCGDFNAADAIGKDFCGSGDCHDTSIFTDFGQEGNLNGRWRRLNWTAGSFPCRRAPRPLAITKPATTAANRTVS